MPESASETLKKIPTQESSAYLGNLPPRIVKFNESVQGNNIIESLYYKGDLNVLNGLNVAVIGTQEATVKMRDNTRLVVDTISNFSTDATIINGMAKGIDTAAAERAQELKRYGRKNRYASVLPSSLSYIFPPENIDIALKAATEGVLISEYPDGIVGKGQLKGSELFLNRNRIVAALSDIVVVVWSDYASGTFNTANWARKLGKKVICLKMDGQDSGVYKRLMEQKENQNVFSAASTTDLAKLLKELSI